MAGCECFTFLLYLLLGEETRPLVIGIALLSLLVAIGIALRL
jgi:hypothetical protein